MQNKPQQEPDPSGSWQVDLDRFLEEEDRGRTNPHLVRCRCGTWIVRNRSRRLESHLNHQCFSCSQN